MLLSRQNELSSLIAGLFKVHLFNLVTCVQ